MTNKTLDVVTLGRCSVDLYGDQVGGPLQSMQSFSKYVGGCPANIAIGAARLGLKSGLITRVGAEQMGQFITQQLIDEGVDTQGVVTDPNRLTALVLLGVASRESFPHIFYRSDCADMALCADDIDSEYIASSRALIITGTHLSTDQVYQATRQAMDYAQDAHTRVVLDIDYRPVLWGLTGAAEGESRYIASEEVTRRLQAVLPHCTLIVGTEEEVHIAGGSSNTMEALQNIRNNSSATIVLKLGKAGCCVIEKDVPSSFKQLRTYPGREVEVFNTLGAGDAFMSGLLYGWLRGQGWSTACGYANACGAIVVSRHGCAPAMPGKEELELFSQDKIPDEKMLASSSLQHLHWVVERLPRNPTVCALAFDHRTQLEELVNRVGRDSGQIVRIKQLIADAAERCLSGFPAGGVIIDDRYGNDILPRFTNNRHWVARPVELPGATPLEFEQGDNLAMQMHAWPREHIAKCLVFYHPEGDPGIRQQQEQKIQSLFTICRQTCHELLLEIILPPELDPERYSVVDSITAIYELGVYPDWWKLPPDNSISNWQSIEAVIDKYDRHCRGIVLLGLDAPVDELSRSFRAVAGVRRCIGFAIGRSLFGAPAARWVQGELGDEQLIGAVAENFNRVIKAWEGRAKVGACQ